jgi:hypothetical protein
MKIKKILKYYLFGESVKEMEMNRILDKVSDKFKLSEREKRFLDLYQNTKDDDMKDFLYLSKNSTFNKISSLLEKGKKVICDLHDRNGKIGLSIIGVTNSFEGDSCTVTMKGGDKHSLHDKFLYNIIYNTKKDEYSLQEQDEYFEPIKIENGNED